MDRNPRLSLGRGSLSATNLRNKAWFYTQTAFITPNWALTTFSDRQHEEFGAQITT